jgi:hypothetical protein
MQCSDGRVANAAVSCWAGRQHTRLVHCESKQLSLYKNRTGGPRTGGRTTPLEIGASARKSGWSKTRIAEAVRTSGNTVLDCPARKQARHAAWEEELPWLADPLVNNPTDSAVATIRQLLVVFECSPSQQWTGLLTSPHSADECSFDWAAR